MSDLVNGLFELKGWVLADAGAFAALISIPLALLILLETVKLRRVETDPEITVFLELRTGSSSLIDLIVKNVGHGQAFDIVFDVGPDEPFWQDWKLTSMTMFASGLKHMAPEQEIRVFVGTFMEINKAPYTITISSKGKERRFRRVLMFRDSYVIDVRQFDGQYEVGGDVRKDAVKALNKIAAATTQISKDVKRLASDQQLETGLFRPAPPSLATHRQSHVEKAEADRTLLSDSVTETEERS